MNDRELIEQYAKTGSETAFAELVQRHLAWVYSAALRQVGRPELAEEIAQSVFLLLARKAGSLSHRTILSGWLFRTTRFVASRARRSEIRRFNRQQTLATMTAAADESEAVWEQLAPHLEQAVAALSELDRAAILLRFYEKKPLLEVGQSLGISEQAAKKRVSRAVDKLRSFLARRGVTLAATVLISALAVKTVSAAPATLATGIVSAAGMSASSTLPQLAQETLRAWRWTKIKLVAGLAVTSVALLFVVGDAVGIFSRGGGIPRAVSQTVRADNAAVTSAPPAAAIVAPASNTATSPKKTGAITGVVLDDQGNPLWGASVWGGSWYAPFARDTTDQSGQFALDKAGGQNVVTVSVDGFATDQQKFDAASASTPLIFKLSRISPLDVRVVDEAGNGVRGVDLTVQQWWGEVSTLASSLAQETDADGRLKWTSPPNGEMEVHFTKLGYRYSRTNKLTADGNEHVVVLHPVIKVQGNVIDADTGDPIPAFKITQGQGYAFGGGAPYLNWDLREKTGSNGVFHVTIEEEQIPYVRLESAGYESLETEIVLANETNITRDFKMKHVSETNSIRGTVLLPDGKPMSLVATMSDAAITSEETAVIADGFRLHAWQEPQIVTLQKQLGEINLTPYLADSLRNERAFICHVSESKWSSMFEVKRVPNASFEQKLRAVRPIDIVSGIFYMNMVNTAELIQMSMEGVDPAQRIVKPQKVDAFWKKREWYSRYRYPYGLLAVIAVPNYTNAFYALAFDQVKADEAQIVCALERYRLAQGQYPETLNELAPLFIAKLPHDIIGGGPFKYRRETDGQFTLYSIGWDETDDGGHVISASHERGDWAWQ